MSFNPCHNRIILTEQFCWDKMIELESGKNFPGFRVIFRALEEFSGLFAGHNPTRGPGQQVYKPSWVESGRVRRSNGTGRARRFPNLRRSVRSGLTVT